MTQVKTEADRSIIKVIFGAEDKATSFDETIKLINYANSILYD